MINFDSELLSAERMVLAVDTNSLDRAEQLSTIARNSGALIIKEGLELLMATSPRTCSELAQSSELEWIADFKLKDIPNTVARAVESIVALDYPPVGITVHTKSGLKALSEASRIASERGIKIFGVTHLTSINEKETREYEKASSSRVVWRESRRAVLSNVGGLVCSSKEVSMVKGFKKTRDLFTLVPGTRSTWAPTNDQSRVLTPREAMAAGADLLVIGRQVTEAEDPVMAFQMTEQEIAQGIIERNQSKKRAA